jgi:hypothetical protein
MGFRSFMKRIFSLSGRDEAELERLRAKHGINVDAKDTTTSREIKNQPGTQEYDVWEDLRNWRTYFYLGSWVTRKFRPIGEERVKRELADLEKKREEEERKRGEG